MLCFSSAEFNSGRHKQLFSQRIRIVDCFEKGTEIYSFIDIIIFQQFINYLKGGGFAIVDPIFQLMSDKILK
jgi:hypothetical protein